MVRSTTFKTGKKRWRLRYRSRNHTLGWNVPVRPDAVGGAHPLVETEFFSGFVARFTYLLRSNAVAIQAPRLCVIPHSCAQLLDDPPADLCQELEPRANLH